MINKTQKYKSYHQPYAQIVVVNRKRLTFSDLIFKVKSKLNKKDKNAN